MPTVLRTLTALQHALLVILTAVGLVRALQTGAHPVLVAAASVLFLGWYAVGVRFARRRVAHSTGATAPTVPWLLGLTGLWLVLVAVSPQFAWVAFSLWLLAGHFVPARGALGYAVATLAVVVWALWRDSGSLTVAEVLGPVIGAAFALIASRGQVELVRDARERQRLVDRLVAAQAEAEALATELAASQREAGVLAERTRLSRDIHDTLAQGFSSIVLLARSGEVTVDEAGLRGLLGRIEGTAASGLDEARRVVGALAPRDLSAGLPATLRRLLDGLTEDTGIRTELRGDGPLDGVPTAVEVALVRTAQGALANVRRHAQASRVVVSLTDEGDAVRLDVVDDGVGFDPDAVALLSRDTPPGSGGYGLPSTRARLRELGGGLEVESAPGEGTAIAAHVPLAPARSSAKTGSCS